MFSSPVDARLAAVSLNQQGGLNWRGTAGAARSEIDNSDDRWIYRHGRRRLSICYAAANPGW
jgi:hypothetical protein